jgi:hypothetical protein
MLGLIKRDYKIYHIFFPIIAKKDAFEVGNGNKF